MSVKPTRLYCMLSAQDMTRAVKFWTDTFGLKPKLETPDWSELLYGDAIVALHGGGDGGVTRSGLGFDVDDIQAACDAVVAAGGTLNWGPKDQPNEGISLADVTDTEGNQFMLSTSLNT
ncbi:MAG TPA: VOC family protein [Acidimicrobiales bacterium]|nr:VOC family protein [Acidimicrobiales bacterium]